MQKNREFHSSSLSSRPVEEILSVQENEAQMSWTLLSQSIWAQICLEKFIRDTRLA